jgi:hypothetical protein
MVEVFLLEPPRDGREDNREASVRRSSAPPTSLHECNYAASAAAGERTDRTSRRDVVRGRIDGLKPFAIRRIGCSAATTDIYDWFGAEPGNR